MKSFFHSSRRPFYLFVAVSTLALASLANAHPVDLTDANTLEKLVARVAPAVRDAEDFLRKYQATATAPSGEASAAQEEEEDAGSFTTARSMIMLPPIEQTEAMRHIDEKKQEMRELTEDVLHRTRLLTGMAGVGTKDPYIDYDFHSILADAHRSIQRRFHETLDATFDPISGGIFGAYATRAKAYAAFYDQRDSRLASTHETVLYTSGRIIGIRSPTIYEKREKSAEISPNIRFAFLTVPPTFSKITDSAKDLLRRMYTIIGISNTSPIDHSPLALPEADDSLSFDKPLPAFDTLAPSVQTHLRRIVGPYENYYNIPPEIFEPLTPLDFLSSEEAAEAQRKRALAIKLQTSQELQALIQTAARRASESKE